MDSGFAGVAREPGMTESVTRPRAGAVISEQTFHYITKTSSGFRLTGPERVPTSIVEPPTSVEGVQRTKGRNHAYHS
jgi:hypothetical protein